MFGAVSQEKYFLCYDFIVFYSSKLWTVCTNYSSHDERIKMNDSYCSNYNWNWNVPLNGIKSGDFTITSCIQRKCNMNVYAKVKLLRVFWY